MKLRQNLLSRIVSVFSAFAAALLPKDKDAVGGIDSDPDHENDFFESRGYARDHFKVGAI